MNDFEEDFDEEYEDAIPCIYDEFPDEYYVKILKLRDLLTIMFQNRKMNDIQFLLLLSSSINLFRVYMKYIDIRSVVDATRYLFLTYPLATKSKKIRVDFCENLRRIKDRI